MTMKIKDVNISEIKPYEKNPRKNDAAVDYVANSISQFGFKQPIVVDKNNVIVCGHTRYKAAIKLGIDVVPVLIASDLSDDEISAYRIADNKVSEYAKWDDDLLAQLIDDIDIDMEQFGFLEKELDEEKYTVAINIPKYEPSERKPNIDSIFDADKYLELCKEIEDDEELSIDEKIFLRLAASRHVIFNYSLIADYYANSNDKIKKHFEKSGLVIIDYKNALENGYVEMREELNGIFDD